MEGLKATVNIVKAVYKEKLGSKEIQLKSQSNEDFPAVSNS